MTKHPAIYIMTNKRNGTLYKGVTSDLIKWVWQHKEGVDPKCFTYKYNCKQLVYYEQCDEMVTAIEREKQIKAGSRKKKLALIEAMNPEWKDLWEEITR